MMRQRWFALLLVLACARPALSQQMVDGVINSVPRQYATPQVLYIWGTGNEAITNVPRKPLPPYQWHTIDLGATIEETVAPNELPTDTKAILLAGLIGSSGMPGLYCGMTATFRAPGSTLDPGNYRVQAVAAVPGGAFRQMAVEMVSLVDKKFEFYWTMPHPECPMFVALWVQFAVR